MRASSALLAVPLALALAAAGCGSSKKASSTSTASTPTTTTSSAAAPARPKPKVVVPKGPAPKKLIVKDLIPGTGTAAQPGDTLRMNYVGVLYKNGKEFDSSYKRHQPFSFVLQDNMVIRGWDDGLEGMKVGGRRELIIPYPLAYGKAGRAPTIPPKAALVFVVDLLKVT